MQEEGGDVYVTLEVEGGSVETKADTTSVETKADTTAAVTMLEQLAGRADLTEDEVRAIVSAATRL